MENEHTKCPHCGASMKMYWHRLTPGIIKALIKARSHVYRTGINRFHLYDDLVGDTELTTTEQMNWTKLRFHGLVAKSRKDGAIESGYWLITSRGFQFLRGDIAIPKRVQTFRNKVVDHDPDRVDIGQVIGTTPYFERRDQFDYDYATTQHTEEIMPTPVTFDEEGQGMLI